MAKNIEINYCNDTNSYEQLYPCTVQKLTYTGTGTGEMTRIRFPQHRPSIFGITSGDGNIPSFVFSEDGYYNLSFYVGNKAYHYELQVQGYDNNTIRIFFFMEGNLSEISQISKFRAIYNGANTQYNVYYIL